jgi:hypothetical protein
MSIDTSGLMDPRPIGPLDRSFLLVIMEFCVLHPKRERQWSLAGGSTIGGIHNELLYRRIIIIMVYHASLSTYQRHPW